MSTLSESAIEDGRVDVDGVEVHYLAAGAEGPPVVLLHGGGLDSAALSWGETLPRLADRYHVFAPDWPGHGESDRPDADYSIPYYIDVLDSFLDALNVDRAHLVGLSMGGGVALGYALDRPDRVDRLVLVDSYGLGRDLPGGFLSYLFVHLPFASRFTYAALRRSRRLVGASLRRVVDDPTVVTPELVDSVVAELARPRTGRAFARFQRSEVGPTGLRTCYHDRLPDLEAPTLFVHGERDRLVAVPRSIRAATLAPEGDLAAFEHCGHWPPREQPKKFARVVGEFLDQSSTGSNMPVDR